MKIKFSKALSLLIATLYVSVPGAWANKFGRHQLAFTATQVELDARPGVEELRNSYEEAIKSIFKKYSENCPINATGEIRIRALVSTFKAVSYLMPTFIEGKQQTIFTIKEQRDIFFQTLGRFSAELIAGSAAPRPINEAPTYREASASGLSYDARQVKHVLSFATALLAHVSNVRTFELPMSLSFLPIMTTASMTVLGLMTTIAALTHADTVPYAVVFDSIAAMSGLSLMPRIGVADLYRDNLTRNAARSFLQTLSAGLDLSQFNIDRTQVKALANGDIESLQNMLCRTELEPLELATTQAFPQVRVEAPPAEEVQDAEVAAEQQKQARQQRSR